MARILLIVLWLVAYVQVEGNEKFQLEVSENKDLNFYLNVNGILKILYLLQLILVTCFNVKI